MSIIKKAVDRLNDIDPMTEARSCMIYQTYTLTILSGGTYALLNEENYTYQVFETASEAFSAVDQDSLTQWVGED